MTRPVKKYLYRYGSTKHLQNPDSEGKPLFRNGPALCGAYGGYPREEPDRPECKRCLVQWEKRYGG